MHLSRTIQRLRRRPAQGCIRRAAILRLATPVGQTLIASASAPNGNNAQGASANLDLIFALNPQDNRISGYSQSVNGASSVQALTYDASGAITAQGGLSLGYDARGLLASASNANGQSLYRHNSLAQRVQKSAQGQSTSTLYGPRQLGLQSQPLSQQQGANTLHHIYLPTPEGPLPVALIVNNSTKLAIHSDHLGTPRRITSSTGEVLWQWVIAGYGEVPPTTSSQAFLNDGSQPRVKIANGNGPNAAISYDLRYPGQQADAETGLFYNHHRSYDPFVGGRYTQADPIGLEGGWNRWGYVEGDPLSFTDSRGLATDREISLAISTLRCSKPEVFRRLAKSISLLNMGENGLGMTDWGDNIYLNSRIFGDSATPVDPLLIGQLLQTLAHEMLHINESLARRLLSNSFRMSNPLGYLHRKLDQQADDMITFQVVQQFKNALQDGDTGCTCSR